MGVPGLWPLLAPASGGTVDLAEMAWSTYRPGKTPGSLLTVGVDASIWLVQAATVSVPNGLSFSSHAQQQALLILLHKLTHLLPLPLRLLFVFDGPGRPGWKRGRRVAKSQVGEEKRWREMIEAVGFQCWTAPGEAEAELGHLSSIGKLDLVISEDVDSLLFKTRRLLLRTKDEATRLDPLRFEMVYRAALDEVLGIDEAGLILVALLSGGDYDETGLSRCGPKVSFALAQAGFGTDLISAFKTLDRLTFVADFLPAFRARLADTLRRNPANLLGRRLPKLAQALEDADRFPKVEVLEDYVFPLTSGSPGAVPWPGFPPPSSFSSSFSSSSFPPTVSSLSSSAPALAVDPDAADAHPERPDLARLAQLIQRSFSLTERAVLDKMRRTVWEGAAVRAMIEELDRPGSWAARAATVGTTAAAADAAAVAAAGVVATNAPAGSDTVGRLRLTGQAQAIQPPPPAATAAAAAAGRMTSFFTASKGPAPVVGSTSKQLGSATSFASSSSSSSVAGASTVATTTTRTTSLPFASSLSASSHPPLITAITRYRPSPKTGKTDYRLALDPSVFVAEVRAAGLTTAAAAADVIVVGSGEGEGHRSRDSLSDSVDDDDAEEEEPDAIDIDANDDDGKVSQPSTSSQTASLPRRTALEQKLSSSSASSAVSGKSSKKKKKAPPLPAVFDALGTPLLLWTPFKLVKHTHPALCEAFEREVLEKLRVKEDRERRKADRAHGVVRARTTPTTTETASPKEKETPAATATATMSVRPSAAGPRIKGKARTIESDIELGDAVETDDTSAAKLAANLLGRSRSPEKKAPSAGGSDGGRSQQQQESEDALPSSSSLAAAVEEVVDVVVVPRLFDPVSSVPHVPPKSKKSVRPTYIELSDSSSSSSSSASLRFSATRDLARTPRAAAATVRDRRSAVELHETVRRPAGRRRRRVVEDSPPPSVGEPVTSSSAGSGAPSPQLRGSPQRPWPPLPTTALTSTKAAAASPTRRRAPYKKRVDIPDDDEEDEDDVDFPADPLAAYKLRLEQRQFRAQDGPALPPPPSSTRTSTKGRSTGRLGPSTMDLPAAAAGPSRAFRGHEQFPSAAAAVDDSDDDEPIIDVIELDASPTSVTTRMTTTTAARAPAKTGASSLASRKAGVERPLGRKGSNPWSKARRTDPSKPPAPAPAHASSVSAVGAYEVIDLTDD